MAFLHGIEHLNIQSDFQPVNYPVTAVIGLVGTADSLFMSKVGGWEANVVYLCSSEKDDAKFGKKGTIPESLKAIRMQASRRGSALVFVVAVCDDQLTPVTAQMIVGTVSSTGQRTGLELFATILGQYGYEPMILIAPHFSSMSGVRDKLQAMSAEKEVMAYIDTPDNMTFTQALTSRGTTGEFANLDEGQKLLFPHFLVANPLYVDDTTTPTEPKTISQPMSAFMAGLRAKVDLEKGWHVSSSNHRVYGVDGMDVNLVFSLGDTAAETNRLNAVGITTAVSMFGNGIVEWGNYTTGFPGNQSPEAFESVRRTRAIMKRAIEQACIPFIDRPLNQANIDSIRNTVNQFLNGLMGRNIIVFGKCLYRKESNPVGQLALGHITFDIEWTPAIPMQRLTFTYKIDLNQLSNLA